MKAYTAKYKYGFLYDISTGQRILLAEGSDLTVTVKEEDILKVDPYNRPNATIPLHEKLDNLRKKGFIEAVELKRMGESLFFEICAGFKSKSRDVIRCQFEIILQEDLLGARKDVVKDFDLIDCPCIVIRCLSDNLTYFEPIYAYSLNDAYMKTYDFYFRLYGKPSANVKTKMKESVNGNPEFLKNGLDKSCKDRFIL